MIFLICRLFLIAPFAWFPTNKHIVDGRAAGPAEFINIIDHAIVVITDSYHGTLFSMNLVFFPVDEQRKGSSTRKDQVLHRMQASESIVKGIEDAVHYLERSGIPSVRDITKPLAGARQFSKITLLTPLTSRIDCAQWQIIGKSRKYIR